MHYFLKPKILCFSTMIDNALTRQRCERHKYQNAYFLPILLIKSLHNMHAACTTCTPLAKRNNYNNQQEQARKTKHKHCAHAINSSNFVIIFFTSFYRSDKNGSTKSCPTNPCNKHSPTFSPSLHSKSSRNSPITMRPIYTCGAGTRSPPQQAPPPTPPSPNTSTRWLQNELQNLMKDPVEGFKIKCDEKNLHLWNIGIFGPPGTIYQGAYFKATLKFPNDCPYQPPEMRFSPPIYHPNVYEDGRICISILHPPGDDPTSGETADERWSPVRGVRSVLLSVVSLLSEPNIFSPAHIDASNSYKNYKENGDNAFLERTKREVEESRELARRDGVEVPVTLEQYQIQTRKEINPAELNMDTGNDFYD